MWFLEYINSVHPKIQFTMGKEVDSKLTFLDLLVLKSNVGSLGHKKLIHMDSFEAGACSGEDSWTGLCSPVNPSISRMSLNNIWHHPVSKWIHCHGDEKGLLSN